MKHRLTIAIISCACVIVAAQTSAKDSIIIAPQGEYTATPNSPLISDSLLKVTDSESRYTALTEADYQKVAQELDVDVAAIKAVSDIEAGKQHKGFISPGNPVINLDRSIFSRLLKKAGINPQKYRKSHPVVWSSSTASAGYPNFQYKRLTSARTINASIANQSTFWGMFQIGGFNWKKCGASSIDDFIEKMSYSEDSQLELFAQFLINSDLVKYLKTKNWRAFARGYNGPKYASKGYHTRLAAAYAKYSKQ